MGAFTRYITKHFLSYMLVIFVLALLNVVIFGLTFFHTITTDYGNASPSKILELFDDADIEKEKTVSEELIAELRKHQIWVMFVNEDGNRVWDMDIPAQIPEHYTIQDIAVLSRGYLNDYPVFVRSFDHGLLVLGYPKDSYMKLTSNSFSMKAIQTLPVYIVGILLFDFLFLFGAYTISKRNIIQSTEPIISALEYLAEGKPVDLQVSGDLSEVANRVSQASKIISRQNQARKNWISGVSHDIRTPLSMIMGYAERIAEDKNAGKTIQEEAEIIRRQSVKIKELVQDLNLVSKLEYEMQPLHKEQVHLAGLLRFYAADLLNNGLPDIYSIKLVISPAAETLRYHCDSRLILRAVSNLVQNSIRHNPKGCAVVLSLDLQPDGIHLTVADNGVGLTEETEQRMLETPHYMESLNEDLSLRHGLGLLIVKRIAKAHDGTFEISNLPAGGCKASLKLSASMTQTK